MKILDSVKKVISSSGIDLSFAANSLRGLPRYLRNYKAFRRQFDLHPGVFKKGSLYPCPADYYEKSGVATGPYFHQDLLTASRIFRNNPVKHVDIGSRVDGLVAHVACFRPIEVFDIRSLQVNIPNIKFVQMDLMQLKSEYTDYCDSVSSLHAVEHFGLGRYGDPIDFFGYLKGLDNIYRILKTGGRFYFSVPIGEQRVEFDAHRVFDVKYLVGLFSAKYSIDAFAYVDDSGSLHTEVSLSDEQAVQSNFGCRFGCGIFEMTKL